VLLLRHAPASIATDLAQPLVVVTYWQSFGGAMWAALFGAIAVASVGYLGVLRLPFDTDSSSSNPALRVVRYLTMTMAMSALACAAALAFPAVFSSDVYAYAGYGDMALHGIDPYAHAKIVLRDPLLDAMQWQWGNPPPMCVYGPAFVWIAREIVAHFLPFGVAAPLWAFRILSCIALVACAPLAYAAFARFPVKHRLRAAGGIALNPVAIWSCAEGHNDVLMLAIVLAGFAVLQRGRAFAGAITIALSALIKAPALLAASVVALSSWPDRRRFVRIFGGAATGVALVAAIAVPLEYGVHAHLATRGHYFPQFSPQALLALMVPVPLAAALVLGTCALFAVRGARDLLNGKIEGAISIALALWFALPNTYPWYALWILPVAFVAWGTNKAWAVIAATLLAVLRYYGDATSDVSPALTAALLLAQFGVPLVLLSVPRMNRAHPVRRESRTPAPDFAPLRSE
jgi:alpha-1,6-mannosyltransferase